MKSTSIPSKTRFRAARSPRWRFLKAAAGVTHDIKAQHPRISPAQSGSGHQWAWIIMVSHGIRCPGRLNPPQTRCGAAMGSCAEPALAFPEGCRVLHAGVQGALAFGFCAVFLRIRRRNNPPRPQIRFFLIYLFTILRKSCIIISYIMTSEVFQWNSNTSAYS